MASARILNLMLAPAAGGLESMALHYHRALEARGAQVLSAGVFGSWFDRALADTPDAFTGLKPASPVDPRLGWALARVAKDFAPDVVLAHGSRGIALAVPALSRQQARVAAVVHNFRARRPVARADLAICVSPAVGADVQTRFPAARVAVVENFAPLSRTPPRTTGHPPRIGTLGRLHAEKGFDILIEAAARLRDRGRAFRLTIAGEGPAEADLKALTARLALTDRIDFPGWVTPPDKLLAGLDLFVCSSRTESFGLVVIEAMAAGAPVIATDIEGPRVLLGEGRYGRLVPPEAPDALAIAMGAALDDPQSTLDMARLAQAKAIAPYDMEAGGERLLAAINPLLEGR
ncbi:MAG TPA: glycosyltransferase [Caulobacteraceae bacterium]|nr:glycosyltransferase [Caulobacteraceae bacterium]